MVQLGDPFSSFDSQSNGPPWKYQVNYVCYHGKINCLLNSLMNTILNGIPYCNIVCNKLDKSLFYWPEFKPRNLPESPSHVFSTFSPLRHIWVIGLYIRYMLWQTSWFSIDRSAFLSIEDSWSSWWSDWVLPHPITLLVDFNPHLYPTQATLYLYTYGIWCL